MIITKPKKLIGSARHPGDCVLCAGDIDHGAMFQRIRGEVAHCTCVNKLFDHFTRYLVNIDTGVVFVRTAVLSQRDDMRPALKQTINGTAVWVLAPDDVEKGAYEQALCMWRNLLRPKDKVFLHPELPDQRIRSMYRADEQTYLVLPKGLEVALYKVFPSPRFNIFASKPGDRIEG